MAVRSGAQRQPCLCGFPQALHLLRSRFDKFPNKARFTVGAGGEIRNEPQVLFSKRAHCDSVARNPPCPGTTQKCQSTTLQNQRNSFLRARDVVQLRGNDLRLCCRVPDRVIHVRTHLLCEQGPDAIVQVRNSQFTTASQRITPRHGNVEGMLRKFEK